MAVIVFCEINYHSLLILDIDYPLPAVYQLSLWSFAINFEVYSYVRIGSHWEPSMVICISVTIPWQVCTMHEGTQPTM